MCLIKSCNIHHRLSLYFNEPFTSQSRVLTILMEKAFENKTVTENFLKSLSRIKKGGGGGGWGGGGDC